VAEDLRVALLGPVEVRVDGRVVSVPGTTLRAVLARLALSPDRMVPVGELVDLLWPEGPPPGAGANLQTYVSRLRRVVGRERVVHEAGGYRLRLAPEDVDVGLVGRWASRAREGPPATAASLLADALDLWRGEPLGEVAGNLAFAPDVARLREWRAHLLAEWLELRLSLEPVAELLPELEHAARAHPLRERMQLLLMHGLQRDGRTADALAVADGYRRTLAEGSGLDPGPEMREFAQRLRTEDARTPRTRPTASPTTPIVRRRHAPLNRFVGRSAELERLAEAVESPGLVTITGPGGVGKSRLLREFLDRRPHGEATVLVALGEVLASGDVATAVAAALGLQAAPDGAAAAVAEMLGAQPLVLGLDNCEHVRAAAGRLAADLLASCPQVRLVATSRQRLDVPGERVQRLGPLAPGEQVELFVDRATRLRGDFDAVRASPEVEAVCALVDGLPLGVELAAGREAVFGVAGLRERLAGGLAVLEPAAGGDRSTALGATVEWSYRLLGPDARALFDRVVVCRGGFGSDALAFLARGGNAEGALAELVEASMVVADHTVDPPRFRVLETMRRAGLGHLEPTRREDAVGAHTRWMQAHVETVRARQDERSPDAARLLRRERANLAEALASSFERQRWDVAGRLGVPLAVVVSDDPHLDLLEHLARLEGAPPDDDAAAARCAVAAGAAAWLRGDTARGEQLLTSALQRLLQDHAHRWAGWWFRSMSRMYTGDATAVEADVQALLADPGAPDWVRATAICNAALIRLFTGDRAAAEAWLQAHAGLLAEVGEVDGFVAYTRGELAAETDPDAALAWFDLAHRRNDERGDTFNREVAGIGRAAVLLRLGRRDDAAVALRELLESLRRLGMWPQVWTSLRLAAELLVELDDPGRAAVLLAAADRDPLAPAILGGHRERDARLRRRIAASTDGSLHPPLTGRAEAVSFAVSALAPRGGSGGQLPAGAQQVSSKEQTAPSRA
jgi:predicted ATPase/DNA-binding SARP family transcriptional activator